MPPPAVCVAPLYHREKGNPLTFLSHLFNLFGHYTDQLSQIQTISQQFRSLYIFLLSLLSRYESQEKEKALKKVCVCHTHAAGRCPCVYKDSFSISYSHSYSISISISISISTSFSYSFSWALSGQYLGNEFRFLLLPQWKFHFIFCNKAFQKFRHPDRPENRRIRSPKIWILRRATLWLAQNDKRDTEETPCLLLVNFPWERLS